VTHKRSFRVFEHCEAVFRICSEHFEVVTSEIVRQRSILEDYIQRDPAFGISFEAVSVLDDAPDVAARMAKAASLSDVGPMAAVAGTMAQMAAEAGLAAGDREVIVDNGGDIYVKVNHSVTVGLYAGSATLGDRLGFRLEPDDTPIAICSSSGKMGHSTSLGQCDLAVVVARDASLADTAATRAANLVKQAEEINAALEQIGGIDGVDGVLIAKDQAVGIVGKLPTLVRTE
jgi:uncharacterized protein